MNSYYFNYFGETISYSAYPARTGRQTRFVEYWTRVCHQWRQSWRYFLEICNL